MKKKLALALSCCLIFSCFASCGGGTNGGQKDENGVKFESMLKSQEERALKTEESTSYLLNEDITGKDYLKLEVKTNVHLRGQFVYVNKADTTQEVKEDFFIEAGDGESVVEFKQFLDSYRANAKGNFDKILKEIRLTNKSETEGKVTLVGAYCSDRKFPDYELELYVEKDNLKVGADLTYGGTLTYLERTSYVDIDGETKELEEVIDKNGNVYIGLNASQDCDEMLSSEVNLINIYDAGRQFQQSFYANVGGVMWVDSQGQLQPGTGETKNGYTPAWCTTARVDGYYWPYNPVQGGDNACNPSQIIDFEVTEDEIYVKTRAMDWSKGDDGRGLPGTIVGGETTKSYMENWYSITSGMLFVKNRFIDWNGFTEMETVRAHTNELPAAYVVHPFNHYVCYTGNYPWTNDEYKPINDLGPWNIKAYPNYVHLEDWFAWTNDKLFGVGVYIPGTQTFASGRSNVTTNKEYNGNKNAFSSPSFTTYKNNKPEPTSRYTSCYTTNTSYTAPVVTWTMKSYTPMTYEYIISVDYVDVMRKQFEEIYESGVLTNESLSAWL